MSAESIRNRGGEQTSEERTPMQSMIAEARLIPEARLVPEARMVPEARALLAEMQPEDRSLPSVPAEMVRPPPLPFQRLPVQMLQDDNVPEQDERPHCKSNV